MVVNRQYRRKHATSTVRAGSLILAPAEERPGDKSARVAAQDEIGDVCQVLMNVQRVKQVDALQYLADLAG